MYYLTTEHSFDAAHFLKGYDGKCSNIHGHRWKVTARICGAELDDSPGTSGMLVDFSRVKADLESICERFDHRFIFEAGSLKDDTFRALHEEGFDMVELTFSPTAENLARYIFDLMEMQGYNVHTVEVYETPKNKAAYSSTPPDEVV